MLVWSINSNKLDIVPTAVISSIHFLAIGDENESSFVNWVTCSKALNILKTKEFFQLNLVFIHQRNKALKIIVKMKKYKTRRYRKPTTSPLSRSIVHVLLYLVYTLMPLLENMYEKLFEGKHNYDVIKECTMLTKSILYLCYGLFSIILVSNSASVDASDVYSLSRMIN